MEQDIRHLLRDQVVVITGTTRGLGRALASACAMASAELVIHGRKPGPLSEVCEALRVEGASSVKQVDGDLRDAELGLRLAKTAMETFGRVDILILNAGVLGTMQPLLSTSREALMDVLAVNVGAQLELVRAVVPGMVQRGHGVVVWLTSGLGRFGLPDYGSYCASKHAVEGLMKVLAEEHGKQGIISVAVAPGMVQTDMLKAALYGADTSPYQTPKDTAEAFVRFLASVDSDANGQSLDIESWLAHR